MSLHTSGQRASSALCSEERTAASFRSLMGIPIVLVMFPNRIEFCLDSGSERFVLVWFDRTSVADRSRSQVEGELWSGYAQAARSSLTRRATGQSVVR